MTQPEGRACCSGTLKLHRLSISSQLQAQVHLSFPTQQISGSPVQPQNCELNLTGCPCTSASHSRLRTSPVCRGNEFKHGASVTRFLLLPGRESHMLHCSSAPFTTTGYIQTALVTAEHGVPEHCHRTRAAVPWGTACSQTRGITWQGSL